ncbi:MAG: hypothetical protein ACIAXF_16680 [Phycisphaerales bacterium JB063]
MTERDQQFQDFMVALGKCFGQHICPPVDVEDATPHECGEAVGSCFGSDITPTMLSKLKILDMLDLADAITAHFECDKIDINQIDKAISELLKRWPVGSLGEYRG